MIFQRFLLAAVCLSTVGLSVQAIPTTCSDNEECLIELPGSSCADGTPSFFTLTRRPGANQVLIYLTGGGACWDKETCEKGYASTLTRKEDPTDWNNGKGIQNSQDPANPFAHGFNIVTVPYCTGDAFTGNRTIDYGDSDSPYVMHHQGYQNVSLVMNAVKKLYPSPEKVVLLGCSAGGIGAYYHMRTLAAAFPNSKEYVISDAGTPFKPPFVDAAKYRGIMQSWGADTTLPVDTASGKNVADFGELIHFNTHRFSNVRFGFISSYRDKVMTFFGWVIGAPSPFSAVHDTIIDAADNAIGRDTANAKVFFTDASVHCQTPLDLSGVVSENTNLGAWLGAMIRDSGDWKNVRPDLDPNRAIRTGSADELPTEEEIRSSL